MAFASQLKKPFLFINFKSYRESLGINAMKIAQFARAISSRSGISIAVAPTYADLREVAKTGILVFAQHIDPVEPGAKTGFVTAESVREAGCIGTLINHSEKPLQYRDIEKCIARARLNNLLAMCCADSLETARNVAALNPDFIAIEPPELIGTGRSVSRARPEIVKNVIESVKLINPRIGVVCGAGISDDKDVKAAIRLGVAGVLASSSVVKSIRPENVIENLAAGLSGK